VFPESPYWAFCWPGSFGVVSYLLREEASAVHGKRVLDFGSGCGIGAIVSAKLGAAHALMNDVDSSAVEAGLANARLAAVMDLSRLNKHLKVASPRVQPRLSGMSGEGGYLYFGRGAASAADSLDISRGGPMAASLHPDHGEPADLKVDQEHAAGVVEAWKLLRRARLSDEAALLGMLPPLPVLDPDQDLNLPVHQTSALEDRAADALSWASVINASSSDLVDREIMPSQAIRPERDMISGQGSQGTGTGAGDVVVADVVLAGDVLYDSWLLQHAVPWLERAASRGVRVLVGDPGRHGMETRAESRGWVRLASYDLPADLSDVTNGLRTAYVWEVRQL